MEARERIAFVAGELFMKYGIRSVSMDDIANNLGMSKKTLYQYYADKDELVAAVVEAHINHIQSDCATCRTDAKNAIEEVFITLERIIDELSNMNPMLLYDLEKFHFSSFQRFRDHKNKFLLQVIRNNIEWGIKDDLYRPDVDIDVLSKFRIESLMIPFNISVFPPTKYNPVHTSRIIIEHFIYGMATVKGHKLIQKYREQSQKKPSYEEQKK